MWLCTVWSIGKVWRSIFSNFFPNRRTLKVKLRKHKDTFVSKLLWASQSWKHMFCVLILWSVWLFWLSGVSCSFSINRAYDSLPNPCFLQIGECATEEIHQKDKIFIRWHHKKYFYQCWRCQEHKTPEQNRPGNKG